MIKIYTILLLLSPLICWGQFKVVGKVYSKAEKLGIPGAEILEKGTKNGVITNINGDFELNVKDENSNIIVSFIGYQSKEVEIRGKEELIIQLQNDCNIDWFDLNNISLNLFSGLINTPIGGEINVSFPLKKEVPVLKTSISYQSNFKNNRFLNGNVGFYHLFESCEFNADININYKSLIFDQSLDLSIRNISTNLNFNKFGLIVGLGNLNERSEKTTLYSPTIGFRTWAKMPLWLSIEARSTINKQFVESNIKINRPFKLFSTFISFYSIRDFNELTVGLGKEISYKRKR